MRKANFGENKVSFVGGSGIWTTDVFTASCQAVASDDRREVTVRGRITAKVNVCGVTKRFSQNVRCNGGLCNSPHTSWKLPPLAKTFVLLDWHATVVSVSGSGPTADRKSPLSVVMSVMVTISSRLNMNSLKMCRPHTRLSSHFYLAFRLHKRRKWVNNIKRVQADRIVLNALHTCWLFQHKRWTEDKREPYVWAADISLNRVCLLSTV